MGTKKQRYMELADFLKTRRARIQPSQVGLPQGPRRRTPGLRREEVAQLAGIGLSWYTWLEQGRPIQVSAQILESLSRVLLLDHHEQNHLFALARQPIPSDIPVSPETVDLSIQNMLDSLVTSPSFIMDQRWNVLAWNQAACFVFGDYSGMNARERNIVWTMFMNPDYRKLFIDWEYHAQGMLARFRSSCGQYVEDPWFTGFVDELRTASSEFNAWWSQHEVRTIGNIDKNLCHPAIGELHFEFCSFDLSERPNLKLVVNTPLPGTDTLERMKKMTGSNKNFSCWKTFLAE